jgi:hypothetical protein
MRRDRWINVTVRTLVVAAVFLAAYLVGCSGDRPAAPSVSGETSALTGSGPVTVELVSRGADAAQTTGERGNGPLHDNGISQLFLTFGTIRLYPATGDSLPPGGHHGGHGGPCDPDSSGFIELAADPITVDALDLGSTLGALLAQLEAPAGTYSHLAVRLTAAYAVRDSGGQVPITVPARDSLLKVMSRFTVTPDSATVISIVLDLDRSIHEVPPGSGNYVLRPVLFGELHHGPHGGPGGGGGGPDSLHHGPHHPGSPPDGGGSGHGGGGPGHHGR